jgi:hypothetical protein
VRSMRQRVSSEGCPPSFARLYSLIFAVQAAFEAAIAVRSFLVALLLLNLSSEDWGRDLGGELEYLFFAVQWLASAKIEGYTVLYSPVYTSFRRAISQFEHSCAKICMLLPALDLLLGAFGAARLAKTSIATEDSNLLFKACFGSEQAQLEKYCSPVKYCLVSVKPQLTMLETEWLWLLVGDSSGATKSRIKVL